MYSLNTITANGSVTVTPWRGGKRGIFAVAGLFDSATVKLETKVGSTWYQLPNCSLTVAGQVEFVAPTSEIRITTSTAGNAASLTVIVCGVEY